MVVVPGRDRDAACMMRIRGVHDEHHDAVSELVALLHALRIANGLKNGGLGFARQRAHDHGGDLP
jgi:hypothetical protein